MRFIFQRYEERSCAGEQPHSAVLTEQHRGTFRTCKHSGPVLALSINPIPLSRKPQDPRKKFWYMKCVLQSTLQLYPEQFFSNKYLTISSREERRKPCWSSSMCKAVSTTVLSQNWTALTNANISLNIKSCESMINISRVLICKQMYGRTDREVWQN